MNYAEALPKLEHLRSLVDQILSSPTGGNSRELYNQIYETYGEVEELYKKFTTGRRVEIRDVNSVKEFDTFFEAGYLSGRTFHRTEGYTELSKVIGAVRRHASERGTARDERTVASVVESLQRFRECRQYLTTPPASETGVQDIIWIILRSKFDRLDREDVLPRFGIKGYRPDFGIPELRLLVEVKYIGQSTKPAAIQEEILADIPGYLSDQDRYDSILVFVYDAAHKLRDARRFIEDLRSVSGIVGVIVVPGIG
jgi:hypothetical protein